MKTVLLGTKEIRDSFRFMDPYEQMDLLGLPGAFALGTTEEKGEKDVPAGLCVVTQGEDHLVITWLYTRPEYRGTGIGSHLMELVFEEAKARDLSDVMVRISGEYLTGGLLWDPESFFDNDVFTREEEEASEWHTTMERISKFLIGEEEENEKAANDPRVITLSELSRTERREAVLSLKAQFRLRFPENFQELMNAADGKLSFFLRKGKSYEGVFLSLRTEKVLYPFLMLTAKEEDEETLSRALMYAAEEELRAKDRIRIRCERTRSEQLLRKLRLPADVYAVASFTATTDFYDEQKAMMID